MAESFHDLEAEQLHEYLVENPGLINAVLLKKVCKKTGELFLKNFHYKIPGTKNYKIYVRSMDGSLLDNFKKDLQKQIKKFGLTKISEKIDSMDLSTGNGWEQLLAMHVKLLPVYKGMRKLAYSHEILVS